MPFSAGINIRDISLPRSVNKYVDTILLVHAIDENIGSAVSFRRYFELKVCCNRVYCMAIAYSYSVKSGLLNFISRLSGKLETN